MSLRASSTAPGPERNIRPGHWHGVLAGAAAAGLQDRCIICRGDVRRSTAAARHGGPVSVRSHTAESGRAPARLPDMEINT
jgi:hypothetical protein